MTDFKSRNLDVDKQSQTSKHSIFNQNNLSKAASIQPLVKNASKLRASENKSPKTFLDQNLDAALIGPIHHGAQSIRVSQESTVMEPEHEANRSLSIDNRNWITNNQSGLK